MQTEFSPAQLADPDIAGSDKILRTCVHCGFCTATCPTFAVLGDELDSPRGRIYLIKQMLQDGGAPSERVVKHIDRCLSCLSCMTTCPSGVHYAHLVDHARAHIEKTYRRPWRDRGLRALLAFVLVRPWAFRLSLFAARIARQLPAPVMKWISDSRLEAMLALAPVQPLPAPIKPAVHPAKGTKKARVGLLAGCAQSVLAPRISRASIEVLTAHGVEVVVSPGENCCGALPQHMGKHRAAQKLAESSMEFWYQEMMGKGLDAIIVDTSGCGTTMKDYGHMFAQSGPSLRARALAVQTRSMDITEYLEKIGYKPTREASGLKIAYHAACSLQHGQGVVDAPKKLLQLAGFVVVTPQNAHLCCGSAGTYNMLQPEISAQLRERKLETLMAQRPDAIAAGNLGCITQLAGGVPVVHSVELLNWMAGGQKPEGLM